MAKEPEKKEGETKSGWNGDQTTALIYLYIRHVGGRGRVHFDYRMTYSDWVRFCGSRMLPIRRSVPREHPSMKMSSTPYGLLHGDFYVISTSISRCLLCRCNNFRRRGIISLAVNRFYIYKSNRNVIRLDADVKFWKSYSLFRILRSFLCAPFFQWNLYYFRSYMFVSRCIL